MSFGPLIRPDALRTSAEAFILLDCRSGEAGYASGHLSGAIHADLERDLSRASDPGFDPAEGGRHPLPPVDRFAARLGAWGIGPGTPVVAYDDQRGGNGAARLWWMLRALGHGPVAVLDGGLQAALAVGHVLTTEVPTANPAPPYPTSAWSLPQAPLERVDEAREDAAWRVVDVRAAERWRGEVEPFDPVPGRIPGAVNLPWATTLDAEGRFLPPARLRELLLARLGDTPPDQVIVHCGSGVTACHLLLAMDLAGMPGAALYVGSYSEWCRRGQPLGRGA